MIWLLFVVVLNINPLPVMSRESRWWFIRRVARVLLSGFDRVEVRRLNRCPNSRSFDDMGPSLQTSG